MGLNWNFLRGGGNQTKKPSTGGVWILSGTTQSTTVQLVKKHTPFKRERSVFVWCGLLCPSTT